MRDANTFGRFGEHEAKRAGAHAKGDHAFEQYVRRCVDIPGACCVFVDRADMRLGEFIRFRGYERLFRVESEYGFSGEMMA